jgi:hypothetical protein
MILTRTDHRTLDYKTWSLIQYRLTVWEWLHIQIANILFYVIPWPRICRATFYNARLEELLCGFVPSRHTILKVYDGDVISDEKMESR